MHGDLSCKYRLREAVLFQDKPQSRGRLGSADRVSFAANAVQVSLSIARRYVSRVDEGK
jgi:hypothetical protein